MTKQSDHPHYLFQAAVGRSGSTILRRSIGLHRDVYYNGAENNLIQDIAGVGHLNCTRKSRVDSMRVDQDKYDDSFRRLICDLTWPDTELRSRSVHFAAINPSSDQLDFLCQIFPNAKFVCLVRNGLEVVCSRMKHQSFAGNEFESQCRTWNRCAEMIDWGEANPDRFFLFRHEWTYDSGLVESKLDELFDWTGVSSDPAVVANIRNVIDCMPTTQTPKEFSQMDDAEKQIYFREKANRCRDWSDDQRREFKKLCQPLMDRLGYAVPF